MKNLKFKISQYLASLKQGLLNCLLLSLIALSILSLSYAATPNPGHPWTEVGDGNFIASGPTTARTYTFPDASTTVLTTNSLVSVAQGGAGTSSLSGVLIGNGTSAVTATTSPAGLLVGTTETQTLTGKTINVNDNSIIDNSNALGDLFKFNGTKYVRLARGSALQVLRTNATGDDLEWVTASSGPAGSDKEVQYNSGGSAFAATSSLTWDNANQALKIGGILELASTTLPSVAATGTLRLVNAKTAGRSLAAVTTHNSGDSYFLQPSLARNFFGFITTGGSATLTNFGVGSNTSGGTVTHVAAQASGFMMNIPTSGSAASEAGVYTNTVLYRGTVAGSTGFFTFARVYFPDTSYNQSGATTGSRIFVGLCNSVFCVTSDNDTTDRIGFARFNTNAGRQDTYWTIDTKDNTTQHLTTTTTAFATSTLYDMYIYCPSQCTAMSWRIDDLTNGTSEEGIETNNLPRAHATASIRLQAFLSSVNAVVRNIRVQKLYLEIPR